MTRENIHVPEVVLKSVDYWKMEEDSFVKDGKLISVNVNPTDKGCRGYIGPGHNPSREEILLRERNPSEPEKKAMYVSISSREHDERNEIVTFINSLSNISYNSRENLSDEIKPEHAEKVQAIREKNREALEKYYTEMRKMIELYKSSSHLQLKYEDYFEARGLEDYFETRGLENIPQEYYKIIYSWKVIIPWTSPFATIIREKCASKQTTIL